MSKQSSFPVKTINNNENISIDDIKETPFKGYNQKDNKEINSLNMDDDNHSNASTLREALYFRSEKEKIIAEQNIKLEIVE